MHYYLAYPFLDKNILKPIPNQQYTALINAKNIILSALYFETNMNLVLSNAVDYKAEIGSISKTVGFRTENRIVHQFVMQLNRKIMNFLSSTYSYTEHGKKLICVIMGDEKIFTRKKIESLNRNNKFMEYLRNYSQHHGFPIFSLRMASSENKSAIPFINVHEIIDGLLKDRHYQSKDKRGFLTECRSVYVDSLNFNELIDEYLKYLWELHNFFIKEKLNVLTKSHEIIQEAILEIEILSGKKLSGCDLIANHANGSNNSKDFMSINPIEHHKEYVQDNKLLQEKLLTHCI